MRFYNDEFYVKSPEEMRDRFRRWSEESLTNTVALAERCAVTFDTEGLHLPTFTAPPGRTPAEHFADLAREGLERRLAELEAHFAAGKIRNPPERYRERLEYDGDQYTLDVDSADDVTGKAAAKADVLARYDIPVTRATLKRPLVGLVSRMVDQKGFDLLAASAADLVRFFGEGAALLLLWLAADRATRTLPEGGGERSIARHGLRPQHPLLI